MTFASSFGRTFSPTFQPKSQAAGGWWDLNGTITSCVAAYQPKGAASYAASLVNLTGNATYDAAEVVGTVNWDSTNGWKADGTNYLDTGVTPDNIYWTMIFRVSNISYTASVEGLSGTSTAAGHTRFYIAKISSNIYWGYGSVAKNITTDPTSGVFALTTTDGYLNGSSVVTLNNSNWLTPLGYPVTILARNSDADIYVDISDYMQAFALYNATLTSTQIGNLTTAMAAL